MKFVKNTSLRLIKSAKGFTLIELMIVVGIIGLLVAIAAPNFARYQSKARQSEAKIGLAAVYSGEKAFYSEYTGYIGGLDNIGYSPEGDKRYYAVGWTATGGTVSAYTTAAATPYFDRQNAPTQWTTCTTRLSGLPAAMTGTDVQSFTVGARGQIRMSVDCDYWTITDTKSLSNNTPNL